MNIEANLPQSTQSPTPSLIARRQAVIDEHMAAESAHDVARALRTFHVPHYDVLALGAQTEGAPAVTELLNMLFGAFPDFDFTTTRTHHAADATVVEGRMTGTHRGAWAGIPASGRRIDVATCCIFRFDEDRLMSESVYFDHATLLAQIGVK